MLTINKVTFYLNKEHIESLRNEEEFLDCIHDKSCFVSPNELSPYRRVFVTFKSFLFKMFFIIFSIDIDPIYNIDPILIQYRTYHVLFYC